VCGFGFRVSGFGLWVPGVGLGVKGCVRHHRTRRPSLIGGHRVRSNRPFPILDSFHKSRAPVQIRDLEMAL
jgi:hypothetical protein